jgi:hypothetical protein
VGGEVRGNYCTWNPLQNGGLTLSNGNLDTTFSTAAWITTVGTFGMSTGKWYWEFTCTVTQNSSNNTVLGIGKSNVFLTNMPGFTGGNGYVYVAESGFKWFNGSGVSYGAIWTIGDVIGIAFNADTGSLTFYKNGTSQGVAYTSIASDVYFPVISMNGICGGSINFGQRAFAYTAPSGFKALVDTNLPAPVVAKSNTVFDVSLWTGNGSTQNITGLAFSPDAVWVKRRDATANHRILDAVRGTDKEIYPNLTNAEATFAGITSFNSDGFSIGTSDAAYNASGGTYVGWCWDAGTSTVSNTQGSITSQVRANPTAGFSVVSYTSTGSSQTAGHGLGVASPFIIQKRRDGTGDWYVGTTLVDGSYDILVLNSTAAKSDAAGVSAPTSTVFSTAWFGTGSENWIAYCFAPVVGYSNGFSYTGNGSTDGVFVYLGMRPKLLLIKRTDTTGNWYLWDTVRNTYNVVGEELYPNLSNAAATATDLDILSNGFKMRSTAADFNASGGTYVGFAWAEAPFAYSRAR